MTSGESQRAYEISLAGTIEIISHVGSDEQTLNTHELDV
jgi:hypothetical protein